MKFQFLLVFFLLSPHPLWGERSEWHTAPAHREQLFEGYEKEPQTDLACSALSQIVPDLKTFKSVPTRIGAWMDLLSKHGTPRAATTPFSRAPALTSLRFPRHLMMADLSKYSKTKPGSLLGKLTLAAVKNQSGDFDIEFISWNQRTRTNDFGVIRNFNNPAKRKLVVNDKLKKDCMTCHKGGTTIFPYPRTEFDQSDILPIATVHELAKADPARFGPVKEATEKLLKKLNGDVSQFLSVINPGGAGHNVQPLRLEKDEKDWVKIIRSATYWTDGADTKIPIFGENLGNFSDLLNKNQALAELNEIALALGSERAKKFGRAYFGSQMVVAAEALAKKNIERAEELYAPFLKISGPAKDAIRQLANSLSEKDSKRVIQSSHSNNFLGLEPVRGIDGRYSDSSLKLREVLAYNEKREKGLAPTPLGFRVSNPDVFKGGGDYQPEARTLGDLLPNSESIVLLDEDHKLLIELISTATGSKNLKDKEKLLKAATVQADLLKKALESPLLDKLFMFGFPAHDEFMATFVPVLKEEIKRRGLPLAEVDEPTFPNCKPEGPLEAHPTAPGQEAKRGACAGCHVNDDAVGVVRFPFDPENRSAWEKALANPLTRPKTEQHLTRVVERLKDKDMPPKDSGEGKALAGDIKKQRELSNLLKYLESLEKKALMGSPAGIK